MNVAAPSNCVNVIVNIANYNPQFTYTAYVRPVGSLVAFGTYPQFTKVATGSQIIFNALVNGQYEVGMQINCGSGSLSQIVWNAAVVESCVKPTVTWNGTQFQVGLPNVTYGYEWRFDEGNWNTVNSNNSLVHILTLAAINAANANYAADRVNALIDFQFRTICSGGVRSEVTHSYVVQTTKALAHISLVKILCAKYQYAGMHMRVTISQSNAGVEKLVFHDPDLIDTVIDNYVRTNNRDTDIAHYNTVLSGFNPIRHSDPNNPAVALAVSHDFISMESPWPNGYSGPRDCGLFPVRHEIVAGP